MEEASTQLFSWFFKNVGKALLSKKEKIRKLVEGGRNQIRGEGITGLIWQHGPSRLSMCSIYGLFNYRIVVKHTLSVFFVSYWQKHILCAHVVLYWFQISIMLLKSSASGVMDRQVDSTCSRFKLDENVRSRLINAMRQRSSTFKEHGKWWDGIYGSWKIWTKG